MLPTSPAVSINKHADLAELTCFRAYNSKGPIDEPIEAMVRNSAIWYKLELVQYGTAHSLLNWSPYRYKSLLIIRSTCLKRNTEREVNTITVSCSTRIAFGLNFAFVSMLFSPQFPSFGLELWLELFYLLLYPLWHTFHVCVGASLMFRSSTHQKTPKWGYLKERLLWQE